MLEVVVATYNGSRFLPELLASLDRQTTAPDRITFRDDGSSDATVQIVDAHCRTHPHARRLQDGAGNVGVIGNFGRLLAASAGDHVMMADQDDVWHPQKIARSLAAITALETVDGPSAVAALAFCDLAVVDAALRPVHPSFVDHQGLRPLTNGDFGALLTQNVAPGCAMIVNRPLLDKALPIPPQACMHDWWLMQIAAIDGRIGFIDTPLIDYRQHGGNAIGAPSTSVLAMLRGARASAQSYAGRLGQAQQQAGELLRRHGPAMNVRQRLVAETFATLATAGPLARRRAAWRAGLRKTGFLRNLAFYALL